PMPAALDGVRIIDLSVGVAGAYCTKLLAGFGAEVIKVEPPGTGDPIRAFPPAATAGYPLETGALHLYLNANKRSITLNLDTPTGQDLLGKLLREAAILVDDRPPGTLAAQGFAPERLETDYPHLVTTLISPFGQDGLYAHLPATNLTTFASGGQMAITGDPDREPLKNAGYQAEYQAGLNAFTATLAGLWAAESSGEGDIIDISAMEVMASTLELMLNTYSYLKADVWATRRGNILSSLIGIYPCADGYLGVHAMPRNWPALARLMDADWMLDDERFRDGAGRLANDDELRALVYAWAADKNKKEVFARAGSMHAPVAYVHDMADLLESPHLEERRSFEQVEHPLAGPLTYPGPPFRLSETPWRSGPAPLLGEDTAEMLGNLAGIDDASLDVLRGNAVIQ
ncbi:MAG: CoA transferase, partial [Dehalococcoidia bacterium]|nr:CoA transferase [Dehalococcoidia bacterium]